MEIINYEDEIKNFTISPTGSYGFLQLENKLRSEVIMVNLNEK